VHSSLRFDLLGNSLAILSGVASPRRARRLIAWIEAECRRLRESGQLSGDLPPCLFPYIRPGDPDWHPRYERFNQPGEYHNGGIWPFITALYIAALVAAGRTRLAERKLRALTEAVRLTRAADGRLVWAARTAHEQEGGGMGQDWQAWSAALYLYAARLGGGKRRSLRGRAWAAAPRNDCIEKADLRRTDDLACTFFSCRCSARAFAARCSP